MEVLWWSCCVNDFFPILWVSTSSLCTKDLDLAILKPFGRPRMGNLSVCRTLLDAGASTELSDRDGPLCCPKDGCTLHEDEVQRAVYILLYSIQYTLYTLYYICNIMYYMDFHIETIIIYYQLLGCCSFPIFPHGLRRGWVFHLWVKRWHTTSRQIGFKRISSNRQPNSFGQKKRLIGQLAPNIIKHRHDDYVIVHSTEVEPAACGQLVWPSSGAATFMSSFSERRSRPTRRTVRWYTHIALGIFQVLYHIVLFSNSLT